MLAAAVLGKLGLELDPHQQLQPLVATGVHTDRDPDYGTTVDNAGDPARHDADHPAEHAQHPTRRLRFDRSLHLDLGFELSARAPGRL